MAPLLNFYRRPKARGVRWTHPKARGVRWTGQAPAGGSTWLCGAGRVAEARAVGAACTGLGTARGGRREADWRRVSLRAGSCRGSEQGSRSLGEGEPRTDTSGPPAGPWSCGACPPTAQPAPCRMAPERLGMLGSPAVSSQAPGLGGAGRVWRGWGLAWGCGIAPTPLMGGPLGRRPVWIPPFITAPWPRRKGRLTPPLLIPGMCPPGPPS